MTSTQVNKLSFQPSKTVIIWFCNKVTWGTDEEMKFSHISLLFHFHFVKVNLISTNIHFSTILVSQMQPHIGCEYKNLAKINESIL